ncbi:ankyrin repeat domain-containing protein [Brachyspira innocens]|uniref:ankyrin repeat domain-containing protein n=1 Tax=Brachyspira innocens TaxID=13264 RepID=UPI0026F09E2A|nr:ankyrin repeat domain-containing protein [Brachyspira innocens]
MNIQLLEAVKNNDFEGVKYLISSGYDINTEDDYYKTPLMYASENGHLEVAEFLKSKGAKQ